MALVVAVPRVRQQVAAMPFQLGALCVFLGFFTESANSEGHRGEWLNDPPGSADREEDKT
jgi:hypothetical protein